MPNRVMIVDDALETRQALSRVLLALGYEVETAEDGVEALAKLPLDIDLVVLDANMPTMDGFVVAEQIRKNPQTFDLPIIMVTGLDSRTDRLRAIEVGINDLIVKPFDIEELRLRTHWLIRLKEARDALKRHQVELNETVARRTRSLRTALEDLAEAHRKTHRAHLDTIRRLVLAAEYKDRDTAAHIDRIGRYCEVLARGLQQPPSVAELIRHASPMHDVGKIGVPDAVLLKPGPLSEDEWSIMRQHPDIGARILADAHSEVLELGRTIALTHHERWDGSGYPLGLVGDAIPLEGRICAVADVFDALTSTRAYRQAISNEDAIETMIADSGKHFDPRVLDVFVQKRSEIELIQVEYRTTTREWSRPSPARAPSTTPAP